MRFDPKMNQSEKIAYYVIKKELKNCRVKFNRDQSRGEPDFEVLLLKNKEKSPLEVTMCIDETIKDANERLRRRKNSYINRVMKRRDDRKRSWIVFPNKLCKVRNIRRRLDDYLFELEKMRIYNFDVFDKKKSNAKDMILKMYKELGISYGKCIEHVRPGKIVVSFANRRVKMDEKLVNASLKKEITKPDNVRKIENKNGEKYFFLYLHATRYVEWYTITQKDIPASYLEFKDKNLTVWIGTVFWDKIVVWKAKGGERWTKKIYTMSDDIKRVLIKG